MRFGSGFHAVTAIGKWQNRTAYVSANEANSPKQYRSLVCTVSFTILADSSRTESNGDSLK